jgi:hypothetical protein
MVEKYKILFDFMWALKKHVATPSSELKPLEQSIFKYILSGRTDIVVKADANAELGKSNNSKLLLH